MRDLLRRLVLLYQSFTAHQHQKGHTVPKQVSPLDDDDDDITESTRTKMVLQSENCTKNCTVWEHSLSSQVWTKCPTRPDTQGVPRGGCSLHPMMGSVTPGSRNSPTNEGLSAHTTRDWEASVQALAEQGIRTDELLARVLKETSSHIAAVVTVIFQQSYEQGILPQDWLNANVSAIYKKGEKASPANYRLVSLTCILCKTMEHVVTSQIHRHLETYNNILHPNQHMASGKDYPVRLSSSVPSRNGPLVLTTKAKLT